MLLITVHATRVFFVLPLIKPGIVRHRPFPSIRRPCCRAPPAWRCASLLWSASRRANASHYGGHQTTSPGRMSTVGPPLLCTHPQPDVTISVCPSGCVCYAVRAPGSNVIRAPRARAGSGAANSGSIRTEPVTYASGPLPEGCEPFLLMSIVLTPARDGNGRVSHLCLVMTKTLVQMRSATPRSPLSQQPRSTFGCSPVL
jgi:hypothetical protein